jgi:hypothetical protein
VHPLSLSLRLSSQKSAPVSIEAEDISSAFRIASRAYRVTVTAQLRGGGRFAREAVIEPEHTTPLGFHLRERIVPPFQMARCHVWRRWLEAAGTMGHAGVKS